MENIAFLIGNGESRSLFDLGMLRGKGIIVGCNALYRNFTPDILVAVDRLMVQEIEKHEDRLIKEGCTIWLNRNKVIENNLEGTIKNDGWTTGPTAMKIACLSFNLKEMYLIGFDLYPTMKGKVNNIYKNTQNYRQQDAKQPGTGRFIKQMHKVFITNENTKFYWYVSSNHEIPDLWKNDKNLIKRDFLHLNDDIKKIGV